MALRSVLRWPALRPESAQLAGWGMLAVTSVVAAHRAPGPQLRAGVPLRRDLFVAGHLVAAGLVAWIAVALWRRFGPRRAPAAYAALAAAALAVTGPALAEDLSVLAGKLGGPLSLPLLVVAVAAIVPLAALAGRLLARPWLRAVGLLGGVAAAVAVQLVLRDDYPGAHLVGGIASATMFGAALATPGAPARRGGRWVLGALALYGAWAVLVRPTNSVALVVQRVPGDVVAPWIARLLSGDDGALDPTALADLDPARAAWWKSRSGAQPVPPSAPPLLPKDAIVVLVTVDCMRADVLAGEEHREDLPTMLALRDAGVAFTEARATAPATAQSIGAIFTGRYYSELYWRSWPRASAETVYPWQDETPRVPSLLGAAGVDSAVFTGMPGLTNAYGVVRGFHGDGVIRGGRHFAPAKQIMKPLLARLARRIEGPLFLYAHFTDGHAPYENAGREGAPHERYLRGLGLVDGELARLVAAVDADPGLRERTAIILTADHGEAFGEHGTHFHATTLYEEALHVPLMARLPGVLPRRVARPVSLIDLAPTLLDLFGVATPGEQMGQSLVPFLRGQDPELTRPIAADSSRLQRAMVFPDGFKIIQDRRRGTVELFDLAHDPGETHDLFDESGPAGAARLAALRAFFKAHTLDRPGYQVPYGR